MLARSFFFKIQLLVALPMVLLGTGCGSHSSSDSTPADTIAPTAPTYVTAVAASDTRVSLRWAAATDSVGVTGYTIYRGGVQLTTTTTTTTVYSDNTCTFTTPYTYAVAARDAANNVSALSSNATTTTLGAGLLDGSAPTSPGTLSATALSSSQISLSWGAATDNIGVSGYNIYRAAASLGPYTKVGTSTTTSYTDTGLTSATTYYYVVKAFDGVPNESPASNEAPKTTL